MYKVFPHGEEIVFNDAHFLKLIKERESIVIICRSNNQKKRRKSVKKEKTMKQIILELDGDELDAYLKEQGFSLNK